MSRSEHATRRERRDPGDLARKRRIKAQVARVRQRPREALPAAMVEGVPIEIRDAGPFIHYPASIEDLRAVMARLPPGAFDGIAGIVLQLPERDEPDDGTDARSEVYDPYLGRLRGEVVPGVYGGSLLGTYDPAGAIITLHAYVYDPAIRDRQIVEIWLRLRMLATFMHELGHHEESTAIGDRARWRKDGLIASEAHAETIEHAWTRDVVVPFLEEVDPLGVAALRTWLETHGGIALPLEVLAGDPRTTRPEEAGERVFFGPDGAFESLVEAVWRGDPPIATQLRFATELHYGLNYDEALEIIARVLTRHPDHAEALVLRADIFVHQERLDDADAIATALLLRDPARGDAWEVIADVARARGDWARLEAAATQLIAWFAGTASLSHALAQRVRARIELADWDGAAADLAAMEAEARYDRLRTQVRIWRCVMMVRRGEYAEGLPRARALVAEGRYGFVVRAALAEAARALRQPCDDVDELVEELRREGYRAWADRIVALQ
jgi:hypothetical protein